MSAKTGIRASAHWPTPQPGRRLLGTRVRRAVADQETVADDGRAQAVLCESVPWVFFAGHFAGNRLYNESGQVGVRFGAEAVTLEHAGDSVTLQRESSDLKLKPQLIVWVGAAPSAATRWCASSRDSLGHTPRSASGGLPAGGLSMPFWVPSS